MVYTSYIGATQADGPWLDWCKRTANRVKAQPTAKPKVIAPGTDEEKRIWITSFEDPDHLEWMLNKRLMKFIEALRHKAVYGVYPDGRKKAPPVPGGIPFETLAALVGQNQITKYLQFFRVYRPEAYKLWLEDHPNFRAKRPPVNRAVGGMHADN